MSRRLHRKEKKLGPPFAVSLLCHLFLLLALTRLHLFTPTTVNEAPVYVDLTNLPVAEPQAGDPAAGAVPVPPLPPPPAPPEPKSPARGAPTAKAVQAPAPPATPAAPANRGETGKEFEERLARLEREAEAKHAAAAMEALRKKVTGSAPKAGAATGTGKEGGSVYATYVRSRLEDAFRAEDTFKPDSSKVVTVRLTIGRSGRVASLQVEKKSPDKMFNDAVMRAISRAERDFPPPPDGGTVELSFVFKPQEVGKK